MEQTTQAFVSLGWRVWRIENISYSFILNNNNISTACVRVFRADEGREKLITMKGLAHEN